MNKNTMICTHKKLILCEYVYSVCMQKGRGHWSVYYTSPQTTLAKQLWGLSMDFYWLVYKVEFPNFSTTNHNLQKGSFSVSSLGIYINLSAIILSHYIPSSVCMGRLCCVSWFNYQVIYSQDKINL